MRGVPGVDSRYRAISANPVEVRATMANSSPTTRHHTFAARGAGLDADAALRRIRAPGNVWVVSGRTPDAAMVRNPVDEQPIASRSVATRSMSPDYALEVASGWGSPVSTASAVATSVRVARV
jgi:hypothetical protein